MSADRAYIFKTHHHPAVFGRDLVILDVRSGSYDLFAGIADQLQLIPGGGVRASDPALAKALEDLELIATGPLAPVGAALPPPRRSALDGPAVSLGGRERWWMARGWLGMLADYYGRSFTHLITTARLLAERRRSSTAGSEAVLTARAAAFDQLSIYTPFQGDCLFRCFMLLLMLGGAGRDVRWVFGVRTWPFLAHCWLQVGDLVLTDFAEKTRLFAPILVI